jgi:hypothetical protein
VLIHGSALCGILPADASCSGSLFPNVSHIQVSSTGCPKVINSVTNGNCFASGIKNGKIFYLYEIPVMASRGHICLFKMYS